MTEEQKQKAVILLKQGLETIQAREYREIAVIPTEDQENFEVKYSFLHDEVEGIFTVVGKGADPVVLQAEFEENLTQGASILTEQINTDLTSAQEYVNEHIKID